MAFEPQHHDVGQPQFLNAFADTTHSAEQSLHTEKVALGVVLGHFDEEGSIATAEVNLQGLVVTEDIFWTMAPEVVGGHEFAGFGGAGALGFGGRDLMGDGHG